MKFDEKTPPGPLVRNGYFVQNSPANIRLIRQIWQLGIILLKFPYFIVII